MYSVYHMYYNNTIIMYRFVSTEDALFSSPFIFITMPWRYSLLKQIGIINTIPQYEDQGGASWGLSATSATQETPSDNETAHTHLAPALQEKAIHCSPPKEPLDFIITTQGEYGPLCGALRTGACLLVLWLCIKHEAQMQQHGSCPP